MSSDTSQDIQFQNTYHQIDEFIAEPDHNKTLSKDLDPKDPKDPKDPRPDPKDPRPDPKKVSLNPNNSFIPIKNAISATLNSFRNKDVSIDNELDVAEQYFKSTAGLTADDIESALGKSYIDLSGNHMSSNSLDVLALYIKGQKLLYTEAKTYCEQQLNFLMLPAIFISCVGSIFSFLANDYLGGPIIIASLNGLNAFILALISYLKLDAKAQAHKTSAYKFDKLESLCEFNSGKFMFFKTNPEDIFNIVEKIETDVKEIKETNQFILPESIRYEFHFTYSTNVFMMVKRMHSVEISETNNLRCCINKLTSLKSQIDLAKSESRQDIIQKLGELIHLEEKKKNTFIDNIFRCRREYYTMDENFNCEIKQHMTRVNKWFIIRVICCDWLKS